MKRVALSTLATALGVGMLFTVPDAAAAQRESPLPVASRMHPDSSTALLQEPPGGKYKKVSTLVALPDFSHPAAQNWSFDPNTSGALGSQRDSFLKLGTVANTGNARFGLGVVRGSSSMAHSGQKARGARFSFTNRAVS